MNALNLNAQDLSKFFKMYKRILASDAVTGFSEYFKGVHIAADSAKDIAPVAQWVRSNLQPYVNDEQMPAEVFETFCDGTRFFYIQFIEETETQ